MTLYEVLGLTEQATVAEIKAAHRQAVKMHHPDVGGDARKFEQVQRAYFILSDPERRARYDSTGIEDDPCAATEEQLAHSAIAAQILRFIVSNDDLNKTDIIANIRSIFIKQKATHEEICTQIDGRIKRLKVLRTRLHRKDDNEGMLSSLMAKKERELNADRFREKAHIGVVDLALNMLDDYSYMLEPTADEEAKIWLSLKS